MGQIIAFFSFYATIVMPVFGQGFSFSRAAGAVSFKSIEMKEMKFMIFIVLVLWLVTFLLPVNAVNVKNPGKVKTVHIYVALCDNEHQGIVKVPGKIGDGRDPQNNLYWGAAFGVRTFFRKSRDWQFIKAINNPKSNVLERILFKHRDSETYILADAYDGEKIKQAVSDFLKACAGDNVEALEMGTPGSTLQFGGGSQLIVYIGHNGLMDFSLSQYPRQKRSSPREAIILACFSKSYFREIIKLTGARSLLWTTGLMAPEAYTLEAALAGWILGETREQIRTRAAQAYDRYQRCGLKNARNLLVAGEGRNPQP